MRLSSPEVSDSSTHRPTHRHKHRRRIPPSKTPTPDPSYEEQELESSPPGSPQDEYLQGDEEAGDELASYSEFPSNSLSPSLNSVSSSAPPPPTYINVAPLPIFRAGPGECPVAHLARFERVCRANNASTVDMILRIFPVTLDGEAALWYELNVEPHPSMSYDEIKSSFVRTYRHAEFVDQSRSELMSIRQGETETVTAFHLRMQWILKKWPDHGLPDSLLRGLFIDGMREDYQDWIVPQRPGSLDEAVRLALSWEQAQSIRAARRRNVRCGFCDGAHEEGTCEVRRRMRELWIRSKEGLGGGGGLQVVSPVGSVVGREGEEEGEGRVMGLRASTQCQCWKHQCWKKLERSKSAALPDRKPTIE